MKIGDRVQLLATRYVWSTGHIVELPAPGTKLYTVKLDTCPEFPDGHHVKCKVADLQSYTGPAMINKLDRSAGPSRSLR